MVMKFRVMSDIHLEFEPINIPYIGEDFLILAGDIQVGATQEDWFVELLKDRSVIYIAGNHEFYGHDYTKTREALRNFQGKVNDIAAGLCYPGRLCFLDNDSVTTGRLFDDSKFITIIGSTLWSDIDPDREQRIRFIMNDYRVIMNGERPLQPSDTSQDFKNNVHFIDNKIWDCQAHKIIVVTHHAPSFKSTPEQFMDDPCNSAFSSDLEHIMEDVDVWIHGHTHTSFDYMIDNCRVVCNPKGYRDENSEFDINKVIEL